MTKILRFIVGTIFLLSGLLKALDAATFANLMSKYGAEWFGIAAPVIIFVEVILGMLLIFNVQPRALAIITTGFVILVSCVYLYGVLARDITDCGCFGPLSFLNSQPWLTFVRNGVIVALLVPSIIKQQHSENLTMPALVCMAVIAVTIMFLCGYSFKGAKCMRKPQKEFQPIAMSDSPLSSLILTSKDSTYFVFAFSYNCPFCLNSIGNVNQYNQMHAVDRVIGLAITDAANETRFHRLFETNFEIHNISPLAMRRIASTLPTSFLVRHDTIVSMDEGMVISPAFIFY